MAITQQEMLNDLLISVAKDQRKKDEISRILTEAGVKIDGSARVAFALLELAVEAFRKHGISPCMLSPILQLKAHGATSERMLKVLMELQQDEELMDDATKKATVN